MNNYQIIAGIYDHLTKEEQLILMDKFTFSTPIELTVNTLLDKINLKGIKGLTTDKM